MFTQQINRILTDLPTSISCSCYWCYFFVHYLLDMLSHLGSHQRAVDHSGLYSLFHHWMGYTPIPDAREKANRELGFIELLNFTFWALKVVAPYHPFFFERTRFFPAHKLQAMFFSGLTLLTPQCCCKHWSDVIQVYFCRDQPHFYSVITDVLHENLNASLVDAIKYMTSPGIVIPVLLLLL